MSPVFPLPNGYGTSRVPTAIRSSSRRRSSPKGTVAYDADGKGGEKAAVFATVEKGLKLAFDDFDIAT